MKFDSQKGFELAIDVARSYLPKANKSPSRKDEESLTDHRYVDWAMKRGFTVEGIAHNVNSHPRSRQQVLRYFTQGMVPSRADMFPSTSVVIALHSAGLITDEHVPLFTKGLDEFDGPYKPTIPSDAADRANMGIEGKEFHDRDDEPFQF